MRAAIVAAVVLGSGIANASPVRPGVIWNKAHEAPAAATAFTGISHVLYLNKCAGGCTVHPGQDDARSDTSSIADQQRTLPGYSYGDAAWNELVQCVRDTYSPFDIQVVTEDPGTTPHAEVMIGGHALDLNPQLQGAGGVAPFIDCGATQDNVISFVFSEEVGNLNFLCGAVAQESSHVWGLDHELDAKDPMTYLDLGSHKVFQDSDAKCGESTPRDCYCGGPTQNSKRYLTDTFGPAHLDPASMTIASPKDGAWVKPGFVLRPAPVTQVSVASMSLAIDGAATQALTSGPFVFTTPTTVAGGQHTFAVHATDIAARDMEASVTVNVTPACGADGRCSDGFHCLGGYCLPGADVDGGLGAACTDNTSCVTGMCGSDGTDQLCTGTCDDGMSCPSGFACLAAAGGNGVCWPSADSGGCATSTGGSPALVLFGLGALVLVRRRRR
jgi:MYXO-CTERM domain-containing protein